ncbi:MAG: sigma 54-interacting transcriptional regulator [Gemmatimonadaceae bacterium]|nr:sigma 54-interacting transcriptional regulator [Gemmatimonadaceae bacterium]
MRLQEPLPVAPAAQRSVSAAWERVVHDGPTALTGLETVRPSVRESWQRSLHRGIAPGMPRAPLALDAADLDAIRFEVDWLPHAEVAIRAHANGSLLDGHIVALFDANARMLAATGDPAALDGLSDINFRPGALWSEDAVGTNGPGTALALGRSIHIIGAEHFCAGWHGWHCAAAPIRDPLTQQVIGVLDLSGFRDRAHPHTLSLATAIAVAVEQRLIAREAERRVSLLRQYSTLVSRYPTDAVLVVDRAGDIMASTTAAERLVRRLAASGRDATDALRTIGTDARFRSHTQRHGALASVHEATHPLIGATAAVHALHDGRTAIGACLVIPTATRRSAGRAAAASVSSPSAPLPMPAASSAALPASTGAPHALSTRYALTSLQGQAPVLDEVRRFARACARTDLPVLLLGESGTGKEVLAQGIHAASPRANGPFVAVNCAALPRELVESELFGHVAGAFSGARADGAIGKFEAADGGTLFLDEIGELPPAAQAALLRVLQEGEVTRLGSHQGRAVDVRIIAATNRDIMQAIASGVLRDDLYHRLNVLTLALPPLREREGDAVLLAHHFLAQVRGSLATSFAPDVLEAFARYAWPGNVRELQNLVLRLAALSEDAVVTSDLLPTAVRDALPRERRHAMHTPRIQSVRGEAAASAEPSSPARDATRHHYAELVAAHATMQDAAAALGITRSTLYRRLQRLGLAPGRSVRGIS